MCIARTLKENFERIFALHCIEYSMFEVPECQWGASAETRDVLCS